MADIRVHLSWFHCCPPSMLCLLPMGSCRNRVDTIHNMSQRMLTNGLSLISGIHPLERLTCNPLSCFRLRFQIVSCRDLSLGTSAPPHLGSSDPPEPPARSTGSPDAATTILSAVKLLSTCCFKCSWWIYHESRPPEGVFPPC